ncbi:MAG: F0F1 ATP synthase subunit B [Gammaproteobacteria bacterium]|nr:MAG: F0F1 ATP synthase subunit B [Gammaproteobacteria bacterium]
MNITVTLLAQVIAFVLLIMFVNRYLWGPVSQMMADRQKRISEGLEAADKGKKDLELAEKKAGELIAEGKAQAANILAQAEKRAKEIMESAKDDARVESDRIINSARSEVEQEIQRAKEGLRGQVAALAAEGAGRILKKEIDADAHADLLNDLVSKI